MALTNTEYALKFSVEYLIALYPSDPPVDPRHGILT